VRIEGWFLPKVKIVLEELEQCERAASAWRLQG
jgi:hypothetical protein